MPHHTSPSYLHLHHSNLNPNWQKSYTDSTNSIRLHLPSSGIRAMDCSEILLFICPSRRRYKVPLHSPSSPKTAAAKANTRKCLDAFDTGACRAIASDEPLFSPFHANKRQLFLILPLVRAERPIAGFASAVQLVVEFLSWAAILGQVPHTT